MSVHISTMPNHKKGWHHTLETRKKISDAHKGIKKDRAWVLKIVETKRKSGTGRLAGFKAWETRRKNGTDRHTEEQRKKMSQALKGRIVWNKGKVGVCSEATRKKMSIAAIKIWNKRREEEEKAKKLVNAAVVITN